ncbi:acetyl/propionyl/methylcrotonyl-CoA carboxylase subunit alpha [Brevundimonas sp.]|uniref:acetyl/propionyl/methylcrotonyl-CoA carboxylase subunit alpha n=1 Tax=Brevundimonas sp. TaxID=1871086 RepID=UPI002AB89257|nr:acetyl/propionyl/methylcrotonyl-CoA carboxylase subunit alpha [Brevundimonas sp.]MDZ4364735.1 acetyl/propionyl/methylcrotonyl-CoA carboxylase subunit alpha [Brevundimonas sp.]
MFKSVLVANRGEIACRVFRTAKRMGIRTIAVYSEADARALHVQQADEAVLIGPAPARESYLDAARVLAAAKATGAEAIHPGYGFLSENADFAEAVMAAGLVWIGAPPAAIRAMGLKDAAKTLMVEAGVPVTPGYMGEDQTPQRLKTEADAIGYPVLIKAVAGGGGKGMRRVDAAEAFLDALASCQREAASSFGDDRVLIEKYILSPRHIEVQVFGDSHGTVVHLYERDCSLQRRHQKVIEEAPAPGMDDMTRAAVTDAAIKAARAVNYVGAGTIEFIADGTQGLRADRIWFMEMNTRLQVEHPVTEAITGVDLVEWQFRAAAGEPVPLSQDEITMDGWAMEARLYAEDPSNGFLPSIGKLEQFDLPWHLRIDSGVEQGGEVSQFYDPMIAKLIVHADDRQDAAQQLAEACRQVKVWPVRTNAAFLARCLDHPRFVAEDVDTGFIAAEVDALTIGPDQALTDAAALAARAVETMRAEEIVYRSNPDLGSPWLPNPYAVPGRNVTFGLRLNAASRSQLALYHEGRRVVGEVEQADPSLSGQPVWRVTLDGKPYEFEVLGGVYANSLRHHDLTIGLSGTEPVVVHLDGAARGYMAAVPRGTAASTSDGSLSAPMPGKIVATSAQAGDTVTRGQPIVVLEAMKMEHALTAPFDGTVESVSVTVGDQVGEGTVLAVVVAT